MLTKIYIWQAFRNFKCLISAGNKTKNSSFFHRYDEEGKGFVTQTEFLRKLKITSDEDSQSDALQEQLTERVISTPDLEVMLQNLR